MLRVLVVDERTHRSEQLVATLSAAGHEVLAVYPNALELGRSVERLRPDVVLIETDSPSRDTLEHLAASNRDCPRPVVVFASDRGSDTIRAAVAAGVSTYVVEVVSEERLQPILEMACASFERYDALRRDHDKATRQLAERKRIERAKGLLMRMKHCDEDEAFRLLRKMAMDRGRSLAEAADHVIQVVDILEA